MDWVLKANSFIGELGQMGISGARGHIWQQSYSWLLGWKAGTSELLRPDDEGPSLPCRAYSSQTLPSYQSPVSGQFCVSIIAIANCLSFIHPALLPYSILSGSKQYVWKKILISLHALLQLGLVMRPSFWQTKCKWRYWLGPSGELLHSR